MTSDPQPPSTSRGPSDTPRWQRRLAVSFALSLALHASVALVRITPPRLPDVHLDLNPTIELGLEEALPGASSPPPAPPSLTPTAPPTSLAAPHPPRVHHPRPAAPAPAPLDLPTPPETQLRPPLSAHNTPPEGMLLERDAGLAEADAALAQNTDASLDDAALAAADASLDDAALATADAPADVPASGIPALASASPGLAAAVPQGSVITMLLRTDRLRENPNGTRVRDMMLAIPDWQDVLGGTEIDPVRDFDQVLLASANPFGTAAHPPDVLALVRLHADRRFVRASIEQMAGVRAPPPPDAGTLYDRFQRPDAGRLPATSRPIWQSRNGAEIATIDRYLGPHAFILLGGDTAAIAAPERVPTLLSVLSRRQATDVDSADTRLVALLQTHGLRNLIRPPPGPVNPVPESLDLVVLATRSPDGSPDGGAEFTSRWRYETPAQAANMVRLSEVFVDDIGHALTDFERSSGGRMAALTGAVHFDRLRSALRALRAHTEGSEMVLDAALDREQVAELLNVQRLAAMFQ